MGTLCSKSDTKKEKKDRKDDGKPELTAAEAPVASQPDNASDPHYPVVHLDEAELARAAGVAPGGITKETGSTFTLSTNLDDRRASVDGDARSARADSPAKLDATGRAGAITADLLSPPRLPPGSPPRKGESYDEWFPPEHDAGMKLGDSKYRGVGVQSPSSSDGLAGDLHSLGSTPNYRVPSPTDASPPPPPQAVSRPSQPQRYDPTLFMDEDSAAPETASSAFATPRELRGGGSAASYADNISLVSHGSMTSQHPHGYHYYNSTNVAGSESEAYPTPASSHRPSVRSHSFGSASSAPLPPPSARTAMTVTSVRTNRQVPAASSAGRRSPFTRQSSLAGSDRFHSCRSIGDATPSAASVALPLDSPAAAPVTEADVLLIAAQQGGNWSARRRGSLGSQASGGYPVPSAASDAGGSAAFYSCRSLATASEQSHASPVSLQPPPAWASVRSAGSGGGGQSLRGAALPPRSPRGSPMMQAGSTPVAQQLLLQRQASQRSGLTDTLRSDAFFSVGGSSHDVFLDLPTAREGSGEYSLEEGESAFDHVPLPQRRTTMAAPTLATTTAEGGAAAAPVEESLGSPMSSSASSAWLASPVLTSAKDRQGAGSGVSGKQAKAGAAQPSKAYYTKADFPPNPHTPPQAKALGTAPPPPPPQQQTAEAVGTAKTPSPMRRADLAAADAMYASLSSPSESSTRRSAATRPTVKYTPAAEDAEGEREASGGATQPSALHSASAATTLSPTAAASVADVSATATVTADAAVVVTEAAAVPPPTASASSVNHSFSTMASSYRREQQQQTAATTASSPNSSQGNSQGKKAAQRAGKKKGNSNGAVESPTSRRRLSQQQQQLGTVKSGPAAHPRGAASAAAPVATNPHPWVPANATPSATSTHADPFAAGKDGQPHPRAAAAGAAVVEHSAAHQPRRDSVQSATTPRTPNGGRGRRGSAPGALAGRAAATTPGHAPTRSRQASMEENADWTSLAPAAPPTTTLRVGAHKAGGVARPHPTPAQAAKGRKAKKSASQPAAHDAHPSTATTADAAAPPTQQHATATDSAGDSVVEYELFTGELADGEAESTAEEDRDTTDNNTSHAAVAQGAGLPQLNQPAASGTSPKLRARRDTSGGFRASPAESPDVLTSAEASDFLRPFTEAELRAEMTDSTAAPSAEAAEGGPWTALPDTRGGDVSAAAAAAVMRAELAEGRPASPDVKDEGYEADSGMPSAMAGATPHSLPCGEPVATTATPRRLSVSVTSSDSAAENEQRGTERVPVGSGGGHDGGDVSSASGMGERAVAAASSGVNVVELSSSSSMSMARMGEQAEAASPVLVG